MRKTSLGQHSKAVKAIPLVCFSVGGRRLAVKAEEVGGIWPWNQVVPVPSGTLFINAILRRGDDVLPVYDLAGRLRVSVQETSRLCLIAKCNEGPMAVCIDGDIPTLHAVPSEAMTSLSQAEPDLLGVCRIGEDDIPIYSLTRLGR
jgi:chemotaxis signal transduction protein